ncbi:hypothetical protein PAXRUDRAFT_8838 [Paxillus rubicundulus Ve08.2h10]|uniref:Uncharacterized protein n=1 Tax=Paxillus rubicundulus Ve08.2h10 TaxID=930991 RepID=A0A0D0DW92_9AGAM|nr:hypothetical protein PAXRUDRAFT_8838 [Paxillus rubicundulus Ve08.2h10]
MAHDARRNTRRTANLTRLIFRYGSQRAFAWCSKFMPDHVCLSTYFLHLNTLHVRGLSNTSCITNDAGRPMTKGDDPGGLHLLTSRERYGDARESSAVGESLHAQRPDSDRCRLSVGQP